MTAGAGPVRGGRSRYLWWALWSSFALLVATLILDAWQRQAHYVVWLLWLLPLAMPLTGMLRDRLRSFAWLTFIVLLYFIMAVLRLFAEPESIRAQLELVAVVMLFCCAMFYIRERGRELQQSAEENPSGAES